jgi:hypothetical protein
MLGGVETAQQGREALRKIAANGSNENDAVDAFNAMLIDAANNKSDAEVLGFCKLLAAQLSEK